MRILMLGWEFPPFISGGLGTACYGLTKALSRRQSQVIFVLPRAISGEYSSHVRLLSPEAAPSPVRAGEPASGATAAAPEGLSGRYQVETAGMVRDADLPAFANVSFRALPSRMLSPYPSAGGRRVSATEALASAGVPDLDSPISLLRGGSMAANADSRLAGGGPQPFTNYQGDLFAEAHRYARLCVRLAARERFDVVHAHDWLTYPAGLAVAAAAGKPLVVHVHSTEFDRSGENINHQVYDVERRGMLGAMKVIAVSHLTKSIIVHRYGVSPDKVEVVYNGIENGQDVAPMARAAIRKGDKIVLFLGRITLQKGPEYFIRAAKKVLEKFERVKFVMAGGGDKIREIIEMAAAEGIGHKVLFTGFLHGPDVERVFKMADVYVMPSVSEPFGIAPLEAIRHDVPVIISKTSGVAEVLSHALKVDFWDTNEIANKIIAVLRHPPLSTTLREQADMEVRRLTWEDAAARCEQVYEMAVAGMTA